MSNKKQSLQVQKEELLKEIEYYNRIIEEAHVNLKSSTIYEDDSSDSEIEFTVNTDISIRELKAQEKKLQTCLHATQELTGLHILESEVNILVDAPPLDGEQPVTAEGVWREVAAVCRIDLLTFSITFYTHQCERPGAPRSFRAVRVVPAKLVHEQELANSVLQHQATPSAAVEMLRSYAAAHRSRRSTLATLAEKYGDALFMETMPEGGYLVRCGDALRLSWTLHNKDSPLEPFFHKMSFDLDYMDESYVKTIAHVHRQLRDPALNTERRTLLLASIIDVCMEARAARQPPEEPEVMGPPKTLPRKSRARGKENSDVAKRAKLDSYINEEERGSNSNVANENAHLESDPHPNARVGGEEAFSNDDDDENVNRGDNEFENVPSKRKRKEVEGSETANARQMRDAERLRADSRSGERVTRDPPADDVQIPLSKRDLAGSRDDKKTNGGNSTKSTTRNKNPVYNRKITKQSEDDVEQMDNVKTQAKPQNQQNATREKVLKHAKTSTAEKTQNDDLMKQKGDKNSVNTKKQNDKVKLLMNTNRRKSPDEVSNTKSYNNNPTQHTVPTSDKVQTLSERFASKQKTKTKTNANVQSKVNSIKETAGSSGNGKKQSNNENFSRNDNLRTNKPNTDKDKAVSSNSVKNNVIHKPLMNSKKSEKPATNGLSNKMKINQQRLKKSPAAATRSATKNDTNKNISKIPQKALAKSKIAKKIPPRISPSKS